MRDNKYIKKFKRNMLWGFAALTLFGGGKIHASDNDNIIKVNTTKQTIKEQAPSHEFLIERESRNGQISKEFSSLRTNLGDGYHFIKVSAQKNQDKQNIQYLLTPQGKCLDCSFIDGNLFQEANLNNQDEMSSKKAKINNIKIASKFIKQAQKNGFSQEDISHLAKVIEQIKDRAENNDINQKIEKSKISATMFTSRQR